MDHAIFETLWNLPPLSCDLMSPSASPVVPHRQIGPCAPLLRFEVADGSAVRHNLDGEGWNNIDQHRKNTVWSVCMSGHSMNECVYGSSRTVSPFLVAFRLEKVDVPLSPDA